VAAELIELLAVSLAVSGVSITISRSQMFQTVRVWAFGVNDWFGELLSCWWCVSHWIAFLFVAYYRVTVLESEFVVLDLFFNTFVVVALAGLTSALFSKLCWRILWGG